jgi:hypothetical protein
MTRTESSGNRPKPARATPCRRALRRRRGRLSTKTRMSGGCAKLSLPMLSMFLRSVPPVECGQPAGRSSRLRRGRLPF